jgi:selenophosphate synthetase-related protein
VALAEACFNPRAILGAEVELGRAGNADAVDFFGEGASTVILSVAADQVDRASSLFARRGLEFAIIGRVIAEPRLRIGAADGLDEDLAELRRIYEDAIPRRLSAAGD